MDQRKVVVIGAGVSALTTALLLSQDPNYNVTIAAKHMPGDYHIEYASPWAGANFMPVSMRETQEQEWEIKTWQVLRDLAEYRVEAGIHFQGLRVFNRAKDVGTATAKWLSELVSPSPWWTDLFSDYKSIPKDELPNGIDNGHSVTSVCINTAIYLPWLLSCCLKNGVKVKRATFSCLEDAALAHHLGTRADIIVNCTGIGARSLGGVQDDNVYPVRGQLVVVRNETDAMYSVSGTDDGPAEAMYIMGRAVGGGTILGGTYEKDDWTSEPNPSQALRIMRRCVDICPVLASGKGIQELDVVRNAVGLRPVRHGGARVESEKLGKITVIHNYGHGGAGYQWSYGCASKAVDLVRQVSNSTAKARL